MGLVGRRASQWSYLGFGLVHGQRFRASLNFETMFT